MVEFVLVQPDEVDVAELYVRRKIVSETDIDRLIETYDLPERLGRDQARWRADATTLCQGDRHGGDHTALDRVAVAVLVDIEMVAKIRHHVGCKADLSVDLKAGGERKILRPGQPRS